MSNKQLAILCAVILVACSGKMYFDLFGRDIKGIFELAHRIEEMLR